MLLHDDDLPRSFRKLARVQELIIGRDGNTRGAVLKVPTKNGGTTTLRRPVQLLYPLELRCEIQPNQEEQISEEQQVERTPRQRPKRQAATEARDRINACLMELDDS